MYLDTAYFAENWKYCNKIIFKYVNSTVNPVLKFFFFNKVFVGPVNNACDSLENQKNTSLPTQDPQCTSSKKKKKKPKMQMLAFISCIQMVPSL